MNIGVLIFLILAAHFLFDWVLQDRREAVLKLVNVETRASHSFWIGFMQGLIVHLTGFCSSGIAILFVLYFSVVHFVIDTPKFKKWWVKNVLDGENDEPDWFWVGLDQAFHFVSLVPPILILCLVGV